jgi:hypothetical protein
VGVLVFAGSALALLISLSNSIGAMAGRGNAQQAQRIQTADTVRDARRSLKRAEEEREGLKFTPADAAAVLAAQTKASAATSAKNAECTVRGSKCREKEAAESAALADLAAATSNKAMTDRASQLDTETVVLREKIEKAGPVLEANSQGSALARLFDLPETKAATLSTYQNLAMALVIEFLIVISLIASEVIEPNGTKTPAVANPKAAAKEEKELAPVVEVQHIEEAPRGFSAMAKPRLIAANPAPIGNPVVVVPDLLEPGAGKIELAEAYAAYAAACRAQGKRAVSPEEFTAPLQRLCEESGIEVKAKGDFVYLHGVRLAGKNPRRAS